MKHYTRLLTIAGSDSGGGAGIQADLKTFSALGCYGMTAITALTAQNTTAVTGIFPVDAEFVGKQLDAVLDDIGVDAVKIGMLNSPAVIKVVAAKLRKYQIKKVVLDPVMVAKSGDKLLQEDAIDALKKELLPLAMLITPNLPEAEVLTGIRIIDPDKVELAAKQLFELNRQAVLVKGGHFSGEYSSDCLVFPKNGNAELLWLQAERIESENTHGTGCTLSSAIASFLAKGFDMEKAIKNAKDYIQAAITVGSQYKIGNGHGPVHHFHTLWQD